MDAVRTLLESPGKDDGPQPGSRLSAGLCLEPHRGRAGAGRLRFPDGIACSIVHVRRGAADLQPQPDLILEVGDRVGLLANRSHAKAIRKFFGDSIRGTAELSFISIGIGAALGLLLGMIPLPIPGGGKMTLGLAGLLLLALCLGKLRRTGPFVWTMPFCANLVLRNFGLTVHRHHLRNHPPQCVRICQKGSFFERGQGDLIAAEPACVE